MGKFEQVNVSWERNQNFMELMELPFLVSFQFAFNLTAVLDRLSCESTGSVIQFPISSLWITIFFYPPLLLKDSYDKNFGK